MGAEKVQDKRIKVSPEVVSTLAHMALWVEEDGCWEGAILGAQAGCGDEVLVASWNKIKVKLRIKHKQQAARLTLAKKLFHQRVNIMQARKENWDLRLKKVILPSKDYVFCCFKGTGTRDFIWLKSGLIGNILMSRAHGRPLKKFKVLLYIFN